jgi:hypothetical protein
MNMNINSLINKFIYYNYNMDNYSIKRQMILNAFKWRDDIKKKSDNELYNQLFLFLLYLSFFSNIKYFYNNINNHLELD